LSLRRAKTAALEPTAANSFGWEGEIWGKDLRGKLTMVERRISVYQTALRDSLEVFDLTHPVGQRVPSGTNLGHQIFQSPQTHAEAKVKRFDRLKSIFR
jgi:hypothetical protein